MHAANLPVLRGQWACHKERRGFTLIELLVVIAILALLVSILVPALQQARNVANGAKCMVHIRNCGQGFMLYAQDNNGFMPNVCMPDDGTFFYDKWWDILAQIPNKYRWKAPMQYLQPETTRCSIRTITRNPDGSLMLDGNGVNIQGQFGLNNAVTWYPDKAWPYGYFKMTDAKCPSEIYMLCDTFCGSYYFSPERRHLGKANILWMDGHVKPSALLLSTVMPNMWGKRPFYNGDRPIYPIDN